METHIGRRSKPTMIGKNTYEAAVPEQQRHQAGVMGVMMVKESLLLFLAGASLAFFFSIEL